MTYTTTNGTSYVRLRDGYHLTCKKCSGTGIYWTKRQSANGLQGYPDTCWRCMGNGADPNTKGLPDLAACERHSVQLAKAADRREAQRVAEWAERKAAIEPMPEVVEPVKVAYKHLNANVGDVVTVTGQVTVAVNVETAYGTSRLIVIETADHELIKLFTTAAFAWSVERDQTITVTGTVKGFDEYEGNPQTQLTRAKLV